MDNGSWRELGGHLSTAVVLAGGVLVGAVNIYVAASLLPTVVGDIGGESLYAWNMTVFLVAQVLATTVVSRVLSRYGGVVAYLVGFGVFAVGSVVCAVSPTMAVMLVGRGVQGLGAGLLTGLGFAVVRTALPRHLWARGSALISAMFGVGNFVGPALGGLFAQFGSWRMAFVVLAVVAVVMAALVRGAVPGGGWDAPGGRLLPRFRAGSPLPWIYLTVALLASGVAVETFLPLFGQRLGGLPPVVAGFLAAALSLGWSVSQIVSASARAARRLQVAGPVLLAAGFAVLALLQHENPPLPVVLAWFPVLLLGGVGIGIAMPHLSVAAMAEGQQAGAAIATVLTLSTALGAVVAGLLVNLGSPSMVTSARLLLAGFAVIAAFGVVTARLASARAMC